MTDWENKRDTAANTYALDAGIGLVCPTKFYSYLAGYGAGYAEGLAERDALAADAQLWRQRLDACFAERDQLREQLTKAEEALSYLAKVPTQPYEREMAQEITKLREQLRICRGALETVRDYMDGAPEKACAADCALLARQALAALEGKLDNTGG